MHKRPARKEKNKKVKSLDKEAINLIRARDAFQGKPQEHSAEFDKTDRVLREAIEKLRHLEATLQEGKMRYQFLYDFSPIAFSETDWSYAKDYIEKLRKSGVKDFRSYFEENPEGVTDCLNMVKVIDVNKTMIDIFKAKNKKEFLANLEKTLADESYENFREKLIAYAEGKDEVQATVVWKTFEGKKRYFALKWSFLPEVKEPRTRMLDTLVDITHLHRAEEEIRKFKTISDNSTVGNAIIDLKRKYIYVNRAFARMHGYRADELVGKDSTMLYTKAQLKDLKRLTANLKKKGLLENVEVWRVKKDGTPFPTLTNATIFRDERGAELYISISAIDITERKKMQEALEQKNHDLEEVNIALRVVIENAYKEKRELEQKVVDTVRSVLRPALIKLGKSGLTAQQKAYVEMLESSLNNNISTGSDALSSRYPNLSPTEVQIANLIREAKKTPDIAKMLHLSNRTIDVHRRNIRKKLNLKGQKVNLQTFLLSIQ